MGLLTDEQKTIIDRKADTYAGDLRVEVAGHRVMLWVAAWQGRIAETVLGEFDDPNAALQEVLEYDGFKNRSMFSAARVVLGEIAKERHSHEYLHRYLATSQK